jgi:AcrR family transcriptional regulator
MSYEAVQAEHREALRRVVLDAAIRLLVEGGLNALSMRRVAAEVGASTTVLYTLFGGKPGLIEALWIEGFDRLWQAEEEAEPADDPLRRLATLGRAYRTHALANPDYYRVMFGGAIPGFKPSEQALALSRRTRAVLVDAVRACIDAGVMQPNDPERVATILWATVHGVVSLEIAGEIAEPDAEPIFSDAMRAVVSGFFAHPRPAS